MSTEQQSLWQEQLKLLAQERDAIAAHCDTLEKTLKHTREVIVGMKLVLEHLNAMHEAEHDLQKTIALTAEINEALGQGVPEPIVGSATGIWDPPATRTEGAV